MRIFEIIRQAYSTPKIDFKTEESSKSDITAKAIVCAFLSIASAVLTAFNVYNKYWFMSVTTVILVVGFAFCALVCLKTKKDVLASVIMVILVGFIFSVYAITGENDGFAILWILLVPPIGMSLIGLISGTILGAYFQIFLCVLFYTPLSSYVSSHYTATFMARFPVLYLTSFAAAILLATQKEYYYRKTESMAFMDSLTGIYNRRYYDEIKKRTIDEDKLPGLTLLSIDINRLKYTNDNFGHKAGDEIIIAGVNCMLKAFPDADAVCRTGGDEFMVITHASPEIIDGQVEDLRRLTFEWSGVYVSEMSVSIGRAFFDDDPGQNPEELEKEADRAMYADKSEFYISRGLDRRK